MSPFCFSRNPSSSQLIAVFDVGQPPYHCATRPDPTSATAQQENKQCQLCSTLTKKSPLISGSTWAKTALFRSSKKAGMNRIGDPTAPKRLDQPDGLMQVTPPVTPPPNVLTHAAPLASKSCAGCLTNDWSIEVIPAPFEQDQEVMSKETNILKSMPWEERAAAAL